MTTALAERPAPPIYTGKLIALEDLEALEAIAASQVNILAHPNKGAIFAPAFQRAEAIGTMRRMLTDEIMKPIMALQGSRLGFRTDKDKERNKDGGVGYPLEVVRDCMIEGILLGARPCGNEINIIASNCYLTREYFTRVLREWPGLTDLIIEKAPPVNGPYGAMVDCKATWKIDGKPDQMVCKNTEFGDGRIVVRVNAGMGADAIFGKADRKLKALVWQKLTGSESSIEGDVDDADPRFPASRTLEIQPETAGNKPSSPPAGQTASKAPAAPEPDQYNPQAAADIITQIEAAKDRKQLRRVYAAAQKASQSRQITPEEFDQLVVMMRDAKQHLPEDSAAN